MLPILTAAALAAASPFTPPLGARPPVAGPRTQVLTLGSPHLSELAAVKPAMLEPLLANLARFRPTLITIEGISGEQCDMLSRAAKHKDAWTTYCVDPKPWQQALGLSQQQAEAASEATFDRWSAPGAALPTASERRKQALLLLAAGERGSAWVQWLRLPPAERIAADGLDAAALKLLNREGKPPNESYHVAAALAARLGLDRVYAVDDHSSDAALPHAGKAYEAALTARFAAFRTDPMFLDYLARSKAVSDGASLLAFYRYLNAPARLKAQIDGDFGGAFADPKAAPYGRHYAAWWETRNLRMLANIRAAMAEHPGARLLNVVGASHRPYYEAWLRQMGDVEVVPLAPYLK